MKHIILTLFTTWNPTCFQTVMVIGLLQTAHMLDQDTKPYDYLISNGITGDISSAEGQQTKVNVNRVRRTVPTTAEQELYLSEHNRYRRMEPASNMRLMVRHC